LFRNNSTQSQRPLLISFSPIISSGNGRFDNPAELQQKLISALRATRHDTLAAFSF
jgi:hypothetical protein